ncbi:hypothetical protein [Streptomyces sp. NPDC002537]
MLHKFASRTVATAAATAITGIVSLGAVGMAAPAQAAQPAIPYPGKITLCNHGAFVLYEDVRDNYGRLFNSKDLNAGECTTTYNHMTGSSTVYLSARDGANTSGSFHTTLGRDQCFSASGLAGDAAYQTAC